METRDKLREQITTDHGNVLYTQIAHWVIVKRLKFRYKAVIIILIVLTSLSTVNLFTLKITENLNVSWIGGIISAIALALNLYLLNFNIADETKGHIDAANELWDVKHAYRSLLADMDDLTVEDIRSKRDQLTEKVSIINKKYKGTDDRSFKKAQKRIDDYTFESGESERLLS